MAKMRSLCRLVVQIGFLFLIFRLGQWGVARFRVPLPGNVLVGIDAEFRPAQKAHIAFCVSDLAGLRRRFRDASVHTWEDETLRGHKRFYAHDPFGNRLEFVEPEGPA